MDCVRLFRSIFSALLLLAFTATPSLACMADLSQMNADEMACCKKMAGDCGAMKNSDHSCCKKMTVAVNEETQISVTPPAAPVIQISLIAHTELTPIPCSLFDRSASRIAHPPPPHPDVSTTILRI